jgi:hypothetical protein
MILEARPDLEVVGEAEDGEGCTIPIGGLTSGFPHQGSGDHD